MNKGSILEMPEDLLDDDQPKQRSMSQATQSRHVTNRPNPPESGSTIDELVSETANTLGIAMEELRDWIEDTALPEAALKTILVIAKRYQLNPLLGQIDWETNLEGSSEVYIPIDGCISLIHRQATFQGIAFHQSPETEHGIPIWMECTIYRSNLSHPIKVREYYAELKTDHPMWSQMPRRMLRHKTLQQCARLAFGISVPNLTIRLACSKIERLTLSNVNRLSISGKDYLKQKLNIEKDQG